MEAFDRKQEKMKNDRGQREQSQVGSAANDLLSESKKLASELYEEGLNKLSDAEKHLKNYSESIAHTIKERPLASLLIAGGIGFVLSKLLRK